MEVSKPETYSLSNVEKPLALSVLTLAPEIEPSLSLVGSATASALTVMIPARPVMISAVSKSTSSPVVVVKRPAIWLAPSVSENREIRPRAI